mgnify:CR=1 FL=1
MVGSTGSVGTAGTNIVMETYFALMRKNVLGRRTWATRGELRIAIVPWFVTTHHRRRRHPVVFNFGGHRLTAPTAP